MPSHETNIILVTGASRSGTTMLSRILGGNSLVRGLKESHYVGDLWQAERAGIAESEVAALTLAATLRSRLTRGLLSSAPSAVDLEFASKVLSPGGALDGWDVYRAVVSVLALEAGKRDVCEQTPRNIYYARRLLDRDPLVRVIHLVRDPRAVCASQKSRWRRRQLGARNLPRREMLRVWINYHPRTVARLWLRAESIADSLEGHPRFMRLRFEDLVDSPEAVVRRICEFGGLPFEAEMLDVPLIGSSQRADQQRRGISPDALSDWQATLRAYETSLIESLCGSAMRSRGYPLTGLQCGSWDAWLHWVSYPLHLLGVALANPRRGWIQARALLRR